MTPEPPTPTPRRKRRYFLWLGVLLLVLFAYQQWKAYDYRAAVKEAEVLGWDFIETSPFDDIKKDWHALFRMATWTTMRRYLYINGKNGLIGNESLILRLNPQDITFINCPGLWNLCFLKHLPDLRCLKISASLELTNANMDEIAELTELETLWFGYCPRVTHLNSFLKTKKLKMLIFRGDFLIPQEDFNAFNAAHPNTKVYTMFPKKPSFP